MPKIETSWSASEAEWGSAVDTLRIELIGHIPNKTESVDTRFDFEGFGLVLSGRGFFQMDDGPVYPVEAPAVFISGRAPGFVTGPYWEHPGTSATFVSQVPGCGIGKDGAGLRAKRCLVAC
jgi:hypothetical protein